jgi:hypothetical protein
MSKRHNGDGAQPYIYHNPSHVYISTLATKHCNVNKTIPYTIDLATTVHCQLHLFEIMHSIDYIFPNF